MKNLRAEYTGGRIIVTKTCDDLVKHIIVSEYSPNGDLLSQRTEYAYGIAAPLKDNSLLPLAFFEAVLANAQKEAVGYLAPELAKNIPEGNEIGFFQGFFGDFSAAFPARAGAVALVYKKDSGLETKLFQAQVQNGFLTNFSIL